jgi:putative ABC transport system ATP-binding protein
MSAPDVAHPALRAESLHRFYHAGDEETQALRGVSITLGRGEFAAVVGPSGSGKSTLLSCLAGLDEPDGGTVRIDGVRMTRQPERTRARIRARKIGMLNQTGNLLANLTVAQNIALTRRLAGLPKREPKELLTRLGIEHRADAYPETLSGGETVRAGLAVALANDPRLLLADEPTGELDTTTERQVVDLMIERAADGVTILVASHSAAVGSAAERIIVLANGAVQS